MSDLREALTAAFDQSESDIPASPATDEPAPVPIPDEAPPETTTPEPTTGERVRDALGRFTRPDQPDGKGTVPPAVATPPGALGEVKPALPTFEKPPRDLPIPMRSHWTALAPEWRQHIAETHQKMATIEQQYQPAVNFTQRFLQTIQPYQHAIQIETNGDAIAAVDGLMKVATTLRFGTPAEKAREVAHIIKTYAVDIETLDQAIVGALPQGNGADPHAIQRAVQEALQPLMSRAQQNRAVQEQRIATEIMSEQDKFAADPKNEYFEDVRFAMADLMEVAERQGYTMSYEDAYNRACLLHPDISKIMLARQAGQSAQNLTQAAQRAKAAAVSVKGAAPVGNPTPTAPSSVREAIEAAIEEHSRV